MLSRRPIRKAMETLETALRDRLLSPWGFRLYLLRHLPLALAAGLRIVRLDPQECAVWLPGGWRTRNPFGSTYFAAQAMAAEMSTGAPALLLARSAPSSVAFLPVEMRAVFSKRVLGPVEFVCSDVGAMKKAVEAAGAGPEAVRFAARSVARADDGQELAAFEVTWSFKRRAPLP